MKKVIAFAAALLLCMGAVGCGEEQPDVGTADDPPVSVGGFTVDGKIGDWSADKRKARSFIPVQDGQSVNIYARKTDEGIIVAGEIKHNRFVRDSERTLVNSHVRFSFGDGVVRYITFVGDSYGVDAFGVDTRSDGKIHTTTFEAFTAKDKIGGFADSIPFGYTVRPSGNAEDYFWGYGADWHEDGCSAGECSLFVTANGIERGGAGSAIAYDGSADDEFWRDVELISDEYYDYGLVGAKARTDADGVYIYMTAMHREINEHQYWCYNPNFEIRMGKNLREYVTVRLVRYREGEYLYSAIVPKAEMNTYPTESGDYYVSECELFVPYSNIPGVEAGDSVALGLAFRADEGNRQPWHCISYKGVSTWDLNAVAAAAEGWAK